MSVLLETSKGDIVIDLLVDFAPKLCENFLKLCKVKYYNYSPVHSIQKSFSFQTGDPLGPLSKKSDGGSSIWGVLTHDPAQRTFPALFHPKLKHVERGTVGMASVPHPTNPDVRLVGSQFIVTLGDDTDYLDGKSAIFGRVVEGFDVLEKINDAIVDDAGYPLVDIRINHTVVLDDPYPDPAGLVEPPSSPLPSRAQLDTARLGEDDQRQIDNPEEETEETAAEREKLQRERNARTHALTLEVMGDLPSADIKPPENVLFVCKLNPVTQDSDLELIFSRFGKILSCEVIRDQKTGDSLQYAFIEFEDKNSCETAYSKMQDVLIDDRRIHVDFSQSVSKLTGAWWGDKTRQKSRGKGGWGGVQELEKWRKYRNEDIDDDDTPYDMVHDDEEMQDQRGKPLNGRAPEADDARPDTDTKDNRDGRYRNRSPYRPNNRSGFADRGNKDRDRWRNEDRDRGRDDRRGKDRPRGNDRDRDRDRGGGRGSGRDNGRDWRDGRNGRSRSKEGGRDDRWRDDRHYKSRSDARSRSPRSRKDYGSHREDRGRDRDRGDRRR